MDAKMGNTPFTWCQYYKMLKFSSSSLIFPYSDVEFANIYISELVACEIDVEDEPEFLRMIDWIWDIVDMLPLVDGLIGAGTLEATLAWLKKK
jgi:hypothetical protein